MFTNEKKMTGIGTKSKAVMSKRLIQLLLAATVYGLCIETANARAVVREVKTDSIDIYNRLLEKSSDVSKLKVINRAINYAVVAKDDYALCLFMYKRAQMSFTGGHYLSALKDLNESSLSIAEKFGLTLSNPASIVDQDKVFVNTPVAKAKTKNVSEGKSSEYNSLWQNLHIDILTMQSQAYVYMSQYGTASLIFSDIMRLYSEDTNSSVAARCYNGIGVMMARKGFEQGALDYFNKDIKIIEGKKNKNNDEIKMLARFYANIASVYHSRSDFDRSLKYSVESYSLLDRINDKGEPYAHTLFFIALSYSGLEKYDLALAYYKQALDYATEHNYSHL